MESGVPINRGKARAYLELNGKLTERFCYEVAKTSTETPPCQGQYQLFREQSYGRGGGRRTSDVLVVENRDLVLFEVNARRISSELVIGGDPDNARRELLMLIVKKLNQLGESIGALLEGRAEIPDVSINNLSRIWPVAVTGATLFQSPLLWARLREEIDPTKTASLSGPKVKPVTILNLGEYEQLWAYVEEGYSLSDLLKRKTKPPWRDRDLNHWQQVSMSCPPGQPKPMIIRSVCERGRARLLAEMKDNIAANGSVMADEGATPLIRI
jgi:hypothetical protein